MSVLMKYVCPDGTSKDDYLPEDEYGGVCETYWMGDPRSFFAEGDHSDFRIVELETEIIGDCELHRVVVGLPIVH